MRLCSRYWLESNTSELSQGGLDRKVIHNSNGIRPTWMPQNAG